MTTRTIQRAFLLPVAALILAGTTFAQVPSDTVPPQLIAFGFAPASIDTSTSPADVTLSFTLKDNASGVSYLEVSFVNPFGIPIHRASVAFKPSPSISETKVIAFPRFSAAGAWRVATIFVADAAGNTTILDTKTLRALGFPTDLMVTSASDTTPPNLTALSFSAASIDTTSSSANVTVSYTATDDRAGCNALQVALVSPSGASIRSATVSPAPAASVTGSTVLTFPKLSEAGTWTIRSVFLSDSAGNTQVLDTARLAARGFPTRLTVTSTRDSVPPTLVALRFPASAGIAGSDAIAGGDVNVPLSFQVTDDLSGAVSFQAAFASPTGGITLNGGVDFNATTSYNGTATVRIPKGSQTGTWVLTTVFLADAAGNTRVLGTRDLASAGFPTQLRIGSN